MSAAQYPVFETPFPGSDAVLDGKKLSRALPQLEARAKRLGQRPLTEFFSANPDDLCDMGIEDGEEEWFSAADGLATVTALLSESEVEARGDLQELQALLEKAHAHGSRWHLAIDF